MARARWLKPEFFTDVKTCALSDAGALVFEACWVECDDGGVCPGDPRDLYGRRFIKRSGWTVEKVAQSLDELRDAELVRTFTHRGEAFLLIPDFARKQGIKPKEWRHLGAEHAAVTNAVLIKKNGVPVSENAVSLAFTPKPLAVAEAKAAAVAGTPPRVEPDYVTRCCLAANLALEEKLGGAFKRLTASSEAEFAATWEAQGVPIALAEEVIGDVVHRFRSKPNNRQPSTLKYFDGPIQEAFAGQQAHAAGQPAVTRDEAVRAFQEAGLGEYLYKIPGAGFRRRREFEVVLASTKEQAAA